MNLISRKDIGRVLERHVLDSLTGAQHIQGNRIVDIGSGAGLPGVPLAIMSPQAQFVLVDRMARRVRFLEEVKRRLALDNIHPLLADGTELSGEPFDMAIARAVATVPEVWDMVHAGLTRDGRLLVYSATDFQADEVTSAQDLTRWASDQGLKAEVKSVTVPLLDRQHVLVEIRRQ